MSNGSYLSVSRVRKCSLTERWGTSPFHKTGSHEFTGITDDVEFLLDIAHLDPRWILTYLQLFQNIQGHFQDNKIHCHSCMEIYNVEELTVSSLLWTDVLHVGRWGSGQSPHGVEWEGSLDMSPWAFPQILRKIQLGYTCIKLPLDRRKLRVQHFWVFNFSVFSIRLNDLRDTYLSFFFGPPEYSTVHAVRLVFNKYQLKWKEFHLTHVPKQLLPISLRSPSLGMIQSQIL